ncbi:hypothetical protein [Streptomyces longispororuber]|uniref:hypothetical protein n=1 Tax=Streptomyces longispororuber TaxID=68230 RepID=UPI00210D71A3|nr:hypothetical protein [Streptomyces longispororuber]MCQ4205757.1 hypothetical protein [Streptomyces longispororuber]
MNIRTRVEQVGDLPPGAAAALGIVFLLLIIGLVWALYRLPDHTKLRSPAARERAERRKASQKRQKKLRSRREALQRRASQR